MTAEPNDMASTMARNAALLAQTGLATGAPPTDRELALWARGELTGPRLAEVDSHIAHDPSVFDAAMAHSDTAAEETVRAAAGHWPGAFAMAATLIVGLALGATLLRTPDLPAQPDTPVVRSATPANSDWRSAAFAAGVSGDALQTLTAAPPQCLDADCASLAPLLYRYGATLANLRDRCPADRAPLVALRRELAVSFELAPYANVLAAALNGAKATLSCDDIAALLRRPTG
ncbi:MAG: hypothetical protein AAFU65_10010 [Pseudomonadota bacterium]